MGRHACQLLLSFTILAIMILPTIVLVTNYGNDLDVKVEQVKTIQTAGTNVTWHDYCSSTDAWIPQSPSSGFDPKHPILESGVLSTTSGYLIVTGIADPVTERMGPLYIKELGELVPIDAIELFQAEVAFTYTSTVEGFLSVYLFDENRQKAVMLRLHDAWEASESHPESVYFTPGEAGDGTVHDEILFGSWSGYLRFWYNDTSGSLVGELDDGTPNRVVLKTSGEFDPDRAIKYIGIQWSRHPGVIYDGNNYRLLDIQLTYDESKAWTPQLIGWMNRKSHQILGSPGAGTDYQVKITVKFGSGTDSADTVYCDSMCQPDFDDIRFTDDDGITLLDYWTESVSEYDNAIFWVKVKDDLASNAIIYMYYGNSTVNTLSNGTATFIFFDDYENNNLERWDGTNGPGYSCATDQVVHGNYALKFAATPGADIFKNLTETGDPLPYDFMVHSWVRDDNQLRGGHMPLVKSQSQFWVYACRGYNSQFSYFQGGADYVHWPYNYTGASDTWFEINVGLSMSTDTIHAWKNGNYMGEIGLIAANGASVPEDLFQIGFGQQSAYITWWDDTYVRKWVIYEPTHGEWFGPSLSSWYHDCSNATGFVYNDDWNINWMPWSIQTGTLSSDGSSLSVTNIPASSDWHGPVFEYQLQSSFKLNELIDFSAIFDADNTLSSYLGYEVLMLGDADRNPVLFFSFHDGWADYRQGAYGISYVFLNGSRTGYGSGYPVTWTSFSGTMNVSKTESGLSGHVDGIGEAILTGLVEADFNREIRYVAIASARYGSDPLIPLLIDEISIKYGEVVAPSQAHITDANDFGYEAGTLGNLVEWTISGFTPTSYEVYRDGDLILSSPWSGGTIIQVDVDNLAPGMYYYTIIVYGANDIAVSDDVIISVTDTTSPVLNHPIDIIVQLGTPNVQIIWQPTDLYPFIYLLYQNDTLVTSDSWISGENLTYSLPEELPPGEYMITLIVWDTSGNYAIDLVVISIEEGSLPSIGNYVIIGISAGSLMVIVIIIGLILRNRTSSQV